mmetsp:Transcript_137145/g.341888  ORF Transcript_137145/g.341888 Transcript_137145/m.341888 type:complete len:203 (+) Transcript_137145:810-1418(+)
MANFCTTALCIALISPAVASSLVATATGFCPVVSPWITASKSVGNSLYNAAMACHRDFAAVRALARATISPLTWGQLQVQTWLVTRAFEPSHSSPGRASGSSSCISKEACSFSFSHSIAHCASAPFFDGSRSSCSSATRRRRRSRAAAFLAARLLRPVASDTSSLPFHCHVMTCAKSGCGPPCAVDRGSSTTCGLSCCCTIA